MPMWKWQEVQEMPWGELNKLQKRFSNKIRM